MEMNYRHESWKSKDNTFMVPNWSGVATASNWRPRAARLTDSTIKRPTTWRTWEQMAVSNIKMETVKHTETWKMVRRHWDGSQERGSSGCGIVINTVTGSQSAHDLSSGKTSSAMAAEVGNK